MDLLTLKDVAMVRGDRTVFRDFSCGLQRGDHLAVLGPSGVGKSTLLALICGIVSPQKGQIVFEAHDLAQLPPARRDALRAVHMGVVFQNLGLATALSIWGNLSLAQRMARQPSDDAFARDLLERLGVYDKRSQKPRTLSRGEAQRAAIARALVVRPKLLIADEPTASLDTQWRDRVMEVLFECAAAGDMSIVLATHDPAVAERFSAQLKLPLGANA